MAKRRVVESDNEDFEDNSPASKRARTHDDESVEPDSPAPNKKAKQEAAKEKAGARRKDDVDAEHEEAAAKMAADEDEFEKRNLAKIRAQIESKVKSQGVRSAYATLYLSLNYEMTRASPNMASSRKWRCTSSCATSI
jgi:hypothetical protein